MKTIIFAMLFHILKLSLAQPILGPNGQDCTPDEDIPEVCTSTVPPDATWDTYIVNNGKAECETNFDCCLCQSITCTNCEGFSANGDSSAFFVTDITISGTSSDPAEIDCGGDSACEGTEITGTNIKQVKCGGDRSCLAATIDITCTEQCKFECDGDSACEGATITANNIENMICGGDSGCQGATIAVTCDADVPCSIECDGDKGCAAATITANNVHSLSCKGEKACEGASITITNPTDEFKLECGDAGCRDLTLNIIINNDITELKEISCGSPNACQDASIIFTNNSGQKITIETWDCEALFGCTNGKFVLGDGMEVDECKCSTDYGCWDTQINQADCLTDTSIQVTGPNDQTCIWYKENEVPDACTEQSAPWDSIDASKIECDSASDCCLCKSIKCTNCDEFKAIGDFAAFQVTDITIEGTSDNPASIDCGGYSACEGTILTGSFIKEVGCGGIRACFNAFWTVTCSEIDLCAIDCGEDLSCENADIEAINVKELKCGGERACFNGVFSITCDENEPCEIDCEGDDSCVNATITATNVAGVKCGDNACNGATITITNPNEDFELDCGDYGCVNLNLIIVVNNDVTKLKQISCGADNGCENAVITITNNGADTLTIEKLDCEEEDACKNIQIELGGIGDIEIEDCLCGEAGEEDYGCDGATATGGDVECFPVTPTPAKSEHGMNMLIEKNTDHKMKSEIENESKNGMEYNDIHYYLTISMSGMAWMNVWAIVCVIVVANLILFWCYCVRNKGSNSRDYEYRE